MRRLVAVAALAVLPLSVQVPVARAAGTWTWPVAGPVVRAFDAPDSPYSAGHRGIDIAAPVGTPVVAPATGVVRFAGPVGGQLFVTIDVGGGLIVTCSFLSQVGVRKGDVVAKGASIASSGDGHAGFTPAHVHLGVRLDGAYVDPMQYLAPADLTSVVRLAPLRG